MRTVDVIHDSILFGKDGMNSNVLFDFFYGMGDNSWPMVSTQYIQCLGYGYGFVFSFSCGMGDVVVVDHILCCITPVSGHYHESVTQPA